ncbi:MAG: hypothetical protein IJG23_05885 [Clostridia bacterium]|nr:hypothetical protein [Clostridia bacterium]
MKALMEKIGKKKLIIIACVAIVLVIAALVLFFVFQKSELKSVSAPVDENYSALIEKSELTMGDLEKSLKDYTKKEDGASTVFTKGDEVVKAKADSNGTITYISYNNYLPDDVQVKLKGFNESMIEIGQDEESVLKLLEKYDYVYNLKTANKGGQVLHIYYYGWTGSEAALELVFTDGKLTFYTINSDDIAEKSEAPDVEDIK